MKVIPLSEGSFTIDKSKIFEPFDEESHQMSDRNKGSILVEVQPFVVVTDQEVILLDAGLGYRTEEGTLQIHQNLISEGIQPESVTRVFMSHLHKDHAGGVSYTRGSGEVQLSFPAATYYIQQKELEYALSETSSSYVTAELACLKDSDRVELLDGNGELQFGNLRVRYEMTCGHSRYHQVFWLEEGGKTVFFGADDAPQLQQMKRKYIAKYDYDGRKCMELRLKWWEEGEQAHWHFLFYHDIKSAVVEA